MPERTEAPTPKRLQDARRRGHTARSSEINAAVLLLVGFWALGSTSRRLAGAMGSVTRDTLGELAHIELSTASLSAAILRLLQQLGLALAPLFGALMVGAIVANVAQTGPLFSWQGIAPSLGKISPLNGIRRIFSSRGLIELLKAALKIAIIGWVAYTVIRDAYPSLLSIPRDQPLVSISVWQDIALDLSRRTGVALLVLAAADYVVQRRQWMQSLRMTRHELREELRQSQGDPILRGRLRQRQRQFAQARMMADVPKADVVITNPIHLAVALRYDPPRTSAPVVVAKGERLIAERIKETARDHGVPIVENPPLARALHKAVEIGEEIPVQLYDAVAGVLAFVYGLRAKRQRV